MIILIIFDQKQCPLPKIDQVLAKNDQNLNPHLPAKMAKF